MNILKKTGLLFFALIALKTQAQTDKATTARILEEKNYVFVATTAIPINNTDLNRVMGRMNGMGSGTVNLTGSSYDLKVTTDSLVAYLPYFGRAYSASYNNDDNGVKFNSKNFTYTMSKRKKNTWSIDMATKDVKDNIRMNLSVSDSGYATLNVYSSNKQSITYNGYLREIGKQP